MKPLLLSLCLVLTLGAQSISVKGSAWNVWTFIPLNHVELTQHIKGSRVIVNFPDVSTGYWLNYLSTDYRKPISGSLSTAFSITTTGAPTFRYDSEVGNSCVSPATVRFYFESGPNDLQRWWSNPVSFVLAAGTISMSAPLTDDQWSSVNGEFGNQDANTQAAFAASLHDVTSLELAFGGGCFFAHGVSVEGGTAQFELLSYSVF